MKKKKGKVSYHLATRLKPQKNNKSELEYRLYLQITYNGKVSRFPFPFVEDKYISQAKFDNLLQDKDYKYWLFISNEILLHETNYGQTEELNFRSYLEKLKLYDKNFNTVLGGRVAFLVIEFAKDNLTYRQFENILFKRGLKDFAMQKEENEYLKGLHLVFYFLKNLVELEIEIPIKIKEATVGLILSMFFEDLKIVRQKIEVYKTDIYNWQFTPQFKLDLENYFMESLNSKNIFKVNQHFFRSNYILPKTTLEYLTPFLIQEFQSMKPFDAISSLMDSSNSIRKL